MRNSWYQLNVVELTVGWMAGTGAWFGCFFFLSSLQSRMWSVPLVAYLALVFSAVVPVGHVAAMRFRKWGLKLYLWSTGLLLVLYAVSGWVQAETQGVVFWLHTGVLPLHLLLFGLPKARHLLAHEGEDWDVVPEHREERTPPSYFMLFTTFPAGALLLWLVNVI